MYYKEILKKLWNVWGTKEYRAEWDGKPLPNNAFQFGGGKCSQRFWEYHYVVRNLTELTPESTVLDIGSGKTNFFPKLIRNFCKCFSVDRNLSVDDEYNIKENLSIDIFEKLNHRVDVITCISVLEHVHELNDFMRMLDKFDKKIILTFEYGKNPPPSFISSQKMYSFLEEIKFHYVSSINSCPIYADNSDLSWKPLGLILDVT